MTISGIRNGRGASLAASAVLAATLWAGPAGATECRSYDAAADKSVDGPCTVEYPETGEVVVIGKTRFVFVVSSRQGQWSTGTLNGKPAVRYEINRVTYSYATLDLSLFVDRSDE